MPLKLTLKSLDEVDASLRSHYVERNGAFTLAIDGAPDGVVPAGDLAAANARVAEFRDKNIGLLKQFEGIDPETVRADRARLSALEKEKGTPGRVAELESALAAERTARQTIEQQATRARVRDHLRAKALAVGALPNGVEMLVDKGEQHFHVEGDAVVAKPNTFSPTRPGEKMTADDWLATAVHEFGFLFKPSTGGNASPARRGGTTTSSARELRDPSPQELGRHAADIKAGRVRVVYSNEGGA